MERFNEKAVRAYLSKELAKSEENKLFSYHITEIELSSEYSSVQLEIQEMNIQHTQQIQEASSIRIKNFMTHSIKHIMKSNNYRLKLQVYNPKRVDYTQSKGYHHNP